MALAPAALHRASKRSGKADRSPARIADSDQTKKTKFRSKGKAVDRRPSEGTLIPTATSNGPAITQKASKALSVKLQKVSAAFYALPVRIGSSSTSYTYISPRASWDAPSRSSTGEAEAGDKEKGDGRTLYITGLPIGCTEEGLKNAFERASGSGVEVRLQEGGRSPSWRLSVRDRDQQVSELALVSATDDADEASTSIPPLLVSSSSKSLPSHRPSAHVRFASPEALQRFLALPSSSLPLRLSVPSTSFLSRYKAEYDRTTQSPEDVKLHADAWMTAFESGQIPSLSASAPSAGASTDVPVDAPPNADEAGDGEWTLVTRGGHHGRSSTLPTQPLSALPGSSDPFSQRSMALRDATAGAKVMKRGFGETIKREREDEAEGGGGRKKRRGGDLVKGFYRYEKAESRKNRKLPHISNVSLPLRSVFDLIRRGQRAPPKV